MPEISSARLISLVNNGETEVSVEKEFIVDRISLAITSGTNTYTLPDYVTSIRRITYQGIGLDPLPRRNQREVFQNSTQQGTPFWYVYNNVGLNKIILFPEPNDNIAEAAADVDLYSQAAITAYFIVEFTRTSDSTNTDFQIMPIFRRQLLKKYVAANAYLTDNANVNLRMAKYYANRWQTGKQEFSDIIDTLINQPRRLVINDFNTFNFFPGSPVLPINRFGISVSEGE